MNSILGDQICQWTEDEAQVPKDKETDDRT
jgi:hypothetical protein